jgi:hypothetical protein
MRWVGGIALAASAVAIASCIDLSSHSCSAAGFVCDETSITLQSPNDAWTAGTYTLAIVADGVPQQCTMQSPDPPAAAQGTCSANGTTLSLDPICPPTPIVCNAVACGGMSNSGFAGCFPGRFTMTLTIGKGFGFMVSDAQPHVVGQLGLKLSVDGNALMNETIAPTQTTTEPNGAGCGTCTNASATLSIAGG